jgi:hypothetical protein
MAALVPSLLYIGNDTIGSIYDSPEAAGSYAIIKSINGTNTSNATTTFSLHILVGGAEAANSNKILNEAELTVGNTLAYDTSIVVPAASSLYITQPGNAVTVTISGVEYVA